MALVGGYLVFQSFATTKKPNYQYSVFSCGAIDKSKTPDYTCQDFSAEAGVYRAYKAALGRYPTSTDYKTFVQPMVGGDATSENIPGRLSYGVVIKRLLATPEAKTAKGAMVNNPNDGQLVANIYKNVLDRTATNTDIYNWVKIKAEKKLSNESLVLQIISTKEVLAKQRTSFLQAKTDNKVQKVAIVDFASRRYTNRIKLAAKTNTNNKKTLENTKQRNADNQKRKESASALAAQDGKDISKSEYESILKNYVKVIEARVNGFKGTEYLGAVNSRLAQIKNLNEITNLVKTQSPDLVPNDQMQREYNFAVYARDQMNREINHAKWLQSEATRSYNSAVQKYKNYQWAKAECQANGGSFSGWTCTLPKPQPGGGGTGNACAGVRSNSSRDAIKACQQYLGVTADGVWGPKTEAAFKARFGYGSGYGGGGGGGGSQPSPGGGGSGISGPCLPGYTLVQSINVCVTSRSANPGCKGDYRLAPGTDYFNCFVNGVAIGNAKPSLCSNAYKLKFSNVYQCYYGHKPL